MNAQNIRHALLTVNLSISTWEARKMDKQATQEVATTHGTDASVGRYHKDLLPGAEEHQAILTLRNAWRVWHYENTLPWGDEGSRVLRSAAFLDYAEGFRLYQDQWNVALDAFIDAYPGLVAKAELRLNTLFDQRNYPEAHEVRRRFAVRMTSYPIPDADDFRVMDGIPPETVERLIADAEDGINARLTDAVKDLWGRMHLVMSNMASRLADPKGKFQNTLVSNVAELLEVVPRLNLTNDPEINSIAQQMRELAGMAPATLRTAPDVREATAKKAAELAKRMSQYV